MLISSAIQSFIRYQDLLDRSRETISGYSAELRYFSAFIAGKYDAARKVSAITLSDIENYLLAQKNRGLSSATRNRSCYILRSFFNYCVKKDFAPKNLAALLEPVKVLSAERATLTEAELELLAAAIRQPDVRTVVQTLFYTGGRISEILNLKLAHVDLSRRVIHIFAGKGKKNRDIPICDPLANILDYYLKKLRNSSSSRFFALERTGQVSVSYVNSLLRRAADEIGLGKTVSAHVLRHSFGTILLARGASVVSIQKLLGHANLAVTSRYLHPDKSELTETVGLFNRGSTPPEREMEHGAFEAALYDFLVSYSRCAEM